MATMATAAAAAAEAGEEEEEEVGGEEEGEEESLHECRADSDGRCYTRDEFVSYYGGAHMHGRLRLSPPLTPSTTPNPTPKP